jgi:hypothetical protein
MSYLLLVTPQKFRLELQKPVNECELLDALGGPKWCAKAQCRQTLAEGEMGLTGIEANSRARKETDPALAGERPDFLIIHDE